MSTEENKDLVRRYFEGLNQENLALLDEICDPDCVNHGSIPGNPVQDREGMKQVEVPTRAALPDIHYEIAHIVAEGDWVTHHWTATASFEPTVHG